MIDLAEASRLHGIPVAQLLRWCRDGLIARADYTGSLYAPDKIRLDAAALAALIATFEPRRRRFNVTR